MFRAGNKLYCIHTRNKEKSKEIYAIKGIGSRDFGGLQMILVNRIGAPDVPLEVYSF